MDISTPVSRWRRFAAFLVALSLVFGLAATAVPSFQPASAQEPAVTVDPALSDELAAEGEARFWVVLRQEANLASASTARDWAERGQLVYERLTSTAAQSQAGLRALLDRRGVDYEPFWIVNAIHVKGGQTLVNELAARPEVAEIRLERTFEIPEPTPDDGATIQALEWNVERIRAHEVWSTFGTRGEGIVVASIDTGVQYDHPAIVEQYRGNAGGGEFDHNYNWFDPSEVCGSPSLVPCDNNGHGTHVTGTMVGDDGGDNQIGVAPGATWIAAKGCESNFCSEFALLASGQWVLAPTDLEGNNPDPAMRPHIVNNSWGNNDGSTTFYQATVQAWVAAGIFPVFSNGNAGPSCGTVGAPASYPESYGVGAFDINDNIYLFSSRGPSPEAVGGEMKPQVTAPGVNVRSSVPTDGYANFTGTSMAAPHVSGTIALMWSAVPALLGDLDETRALLGESAIDTDDTTCGGTPENNNTWGEGRLDAFTAVDLAPKGPTGSLTGTVSDSISAAPIQGATVTVTVEDRPRSTRTGTDGGYLFPSVPIGTHNVSAQALGYRPAGDTATVNEDETTVVNLALDPLPSLSGTVTDANDGQPVAGVEVSASSGDETVTTTTAGDGTYQMYLEIGTWQVTFEAERYASEAHEVVADHDGQQLVLDVELRTGVADVTPTAIDTILTVGSQRTFNLTLTNTGSADLTWQTLERGGGQISGTLEWIAAPGAAVTMESNAQGTTTAQPSAARWTPDGPAIQQPSILIYADDAYHAAPNTYTDVALQQLGLAYTAFYNGNFGGFESALNQGGWDIVLFANDNFFPPASLFTAMNNHVQAGGKLVIHTWTMGFESGNPLWSTLGVQWIADDTDPPAPVMWWEADHPAFTDPRSVPEFTSLTSGRYGIYGQRVQPIGDVEALGGYTPAEADNQAAIVVANDDRTIFRGFADGHNDADRDGDGLRDGAELWMNLIQGVDQGFFTDVPWLTADPDSGSLAPGESVEIAVTIDTADLEPGVYGASLVLDTDAARQPRVSIPVQVIVSAYRQGINVGGAAYTDQLEDVWAADRQFDGAWGYTGQSRAVSTKRAVDGTDDPTLYQSARTGQGFEYRFADLPAGTYQLELLFAEIEQRQPGRRVFDVLSGSRALLVAYDIAADVGRNTAVVHRFEINVSSGGTVVVRFVNRVGQGQPILNSIRLTHRPDLGG